MESLPSAAANWGAASHIGDSNVAGFPDTHGQIIVNDCVGDVITRSRFPGTTLRARQLASDCSKTGMERSPYEHIFKYATAAALTGAIALAATPSEARNGRNAAAIGFGVGAIAGAAIAGSAYSNGYYGYYGEPGYIYGYAPRYAYDSYVYEPAPAYGPAYGTGYAYAPAYTSGGYGYDSPWLDPHRTNNFSISSQR